jgi:lysophospholipase L1-like esterase
VLGVVVGVLLTVGYLDAGDSKLAGLVIQSVADYKGWLQDMAERLPDEEVKECRCLEVEYFIMRTALV